MKNLIQFATRIDKDLKEKVMEFSKDNETSVQKIVEYSLKETLNDKNFNKSKTSIFLEKQVNLLKNEGYYKAEELILSLDGFLTDNNIKITKEIKLGLLEFLEIKSKVDNAIDLYSISE